MYFASDNCAPVHPAIMQALHRANSGHAPSYGADALSQAVCDQVRAVFEAPDAAVFLVATGSTANVLALATQVQPWQTIYCHRDAHVSVDECGAPEFYTGGAKLALLDGEHGKISPDALETAVKSTPQGDVHAVQRGAVSITNATEAGTIYSPTEVTAITTVAKAHCIPVHMDGARFANALVAANCSPAEMTWKAGVDMLSLGGTKNGLMGVEAVILFDPEKAWEFELRRKRGGHLFSKHRYLSAQMQAYLDGGLWLDLAATANARAARLAQGIMALGDTPLMHPPDSNMVFAKLPRGLHRRAKAAGAVYHFAPMDLSYDGDKSEILGARLVCDWSTSDEEIDQLLAVFKG